MGWYRVYSESFDIKMYRYRLQSDSPSMFIPIFLFENAIIQAMNFGIIKYT